jgi:hypothetical protein
LITPEEGGELTTSDGFDIEFPPGAVTQNVIIYYESLYNPTQPLNNNRGSLLSFLLTARREGTEEPVTQFEEPYTLTLNYTDEQLSQLGIDEQSLNIIFWDEGSSSWIDVLPCATGFNCIHNTEEYFVRIQLDHLTEFALVGEAVEEEKTLYLPLITK